jgi:hypothetical protein
MTDTNHATHALDTLNTNLNMHDNPIPIGLTTAGGATTPPMRASVVCCSAGSGNKNKMDSLSRPQAPRPARAVLDVDIRKNSRRWNWLPVSRGTPRSGPRRAWRSGACSVGCWTRSWARLQATSQGDEQQGRDGERPGEHDPAQHRHMGMVNGFNTPAPDLLTTIRSAELPYPEGMVLTNAGKDFFGIKIYHPELAAFAIDISPAKLRNFLIAKVREKASNPETILPGLLMAVCFAKFLEARSSGGRNGRPPTHRRARGRIPRLGGELAGAS